MPALDLLFGRSLGGSSWGGMLGIASGIFRRHAAQLRDHQRLLLLRRSNLGGVLRLARRDA